MADIEILEDSHHGSPVVQLVVVCYDGHTYSKSMDQPGKVANLGQLNRENEYLPVRVVRT